ncbi:MAG: hypothetical protein LBR92_01230 [Puniceicoccales bacterium]|jgi:hypothetical protein|nr:hypothetical protein [Puniceicoccales bacterium]
MGRGLELDDTHMGKVANPSGVKRASGDSSAGVDAATLKAVGENLVVNGMIDLTAIQMIERSTISHLNRNGMEAVGGTQRNEKRSEKINELALGMNATNFESAKVNSLGDIMCELMVLMIQSTSERREMEREMKTVLTVAQVEQSKSLAEDIKAKMEIEVERIETSAWVQFGVAAASTAVSVGGSIMQGAKMAKDPYTMTMGGVRDQMGTEKQMKGWLSSIGEVGTALGDLDDVKKSSQLEESIQKKQTALKLTRSIGSAVESSLKSIDSTRDQFLSILTQINQTLHDGAMKIIRNSAV